MFKARFRITEENEEELLDIFKNLKNTILENDDKDSVFDYELRGEQFPCVVIEDNDKKRLFRRAMWINRKLVNNGFNGYFKFWEAPNG